MEARCRCHPCSFPASSLPCLQLVSRVICTVEVRRNACTIPLPQFASWSLCLLGAGYMTDQSDVYVLPLEEPSYVFSPFKRGLSLSSLNVLSRSWTIFRVRMSLVRVVSHCSVFTHRLVGVTFQRLSVMCIVHFTCSCPPRRTCSRSCNKYRLGRIPIVAR
ncbi:hypothetical protein BDZ97DRAFT_1113513 [Flammula alnicola]|nr:hypothetical protein BDZ97DRAFT_1113513 [Flammula alnicola]